MFLFQSNYPSNSGPPPPPNPFGAGAYQGGMAGGAYNNYGYSAYNVNQYPQAGGYQQYGYGGKEQYPTVLFTITTLEQIIFFVYIIVLQLTV